MASETKPFVLQVKFLALGFLLCSFSGSFANPGHEESGWKTHYEDDKIRISYLFGECHLPEWGLHHEYVYLRFVNKTSGSLQVDWNAALWYNSDCRNCDSADRELNFSLVLSPGEELEGNCSPGTSDGMKIFSKMLDLENKSVLTDFRLQNIRIKSNPR